MLLSLLVFPSSLTGLFYLGAPCSPTARGRGLAGEGRILPGRHGGRREHAVGLPEAVDASDRSRRRLLAKIALPSAQDVPVLQRLLPGAGTQPSALARLVGSNSSDARLQVFSFKVVDVLLGALQLLLECRLLLLKF